MFDWSTFDISSLLVISKPTRAGFTGTRHGFNEEQKAEFQKLIPYFKSLSHGDCVGADAEAHGMALLAEVPVTIYPPEKQDLRAFCKGFDAIKPEKSYFARNRDIVDNSDLLIAVPCTETDPGQGGTWYTINYARKKNKPIIIILPSGTVVKENLKEL